MKYPDYVYLIKDGVINLIGEDNYKTNISNR